MTRARPVSETITLYVPFRLVTRGGRKQMIVPDDARVRRKADDKHLLRKAAERSTETVWRRIGTLLDQFTPQECENYLRNSGYGST